MDLPVVVSKNDDGTYTVEVPVLPGCVAQGKTVEEAMANVKRIAELCLQEPDEEGWFEPELNARDMEGEEEDLGLS